MILIDTSVWSLAYRRRPEMLSPDERAMVEELRRLATEDLVVLIRPVRFEVLSGIRDIARFQKVRDYLSSFRLLPLEIATYDLAAEFYNQCRAGGVTPGAIDMLIAAAAVEHAAAVFTTDQNFGHYARHLPVRVHTFR